MVPNATRVTVRLVVCLSGTLVTIISKRRAEKGGLVMLFDIFATHAGLVCDVSDTDHWAWAQNDSIHGCFVQLLHVNLTIHGQKLGEKLL